MYHVHLLVACVLRGASWWWQNLTEACWSFGSKWLIYVNIFTKYYVHCEVFTIFILTTAQWFDTKNISNHTAVLSDRYLTSINDRCSTGIWNVCNLNIVRGFGNGPDLGLKKYLCERYFILIVCCWNGYYI
jgi:hypothetical protein